MDIETVRQISLARHLYDLGEASLRSSNDLHLFAAVNLLQDAVESFLIAVGGFVNANIDQNTKFDKYFLEINQKIAPKELPFKLALLRLNRIRVDSKHYGIQPARDECNRLVVSVREFFDETTSSLLGVSFATVSAIDLLEDGEVKQLLMDAKTALESGAHEECVIECRKAIFLEIERYYDVSKYAAGNPGLLEGITSAPPFARSKEYIDTAVKDLTDYIVLDHSKIDQELMKQGADPTDFWNLWRLTPEVYRPPSGGDWTVRYDFAKLDSTVLSDKVEYVFTTTIDLILALHTYRKSIRTRDPRNYYVELTKENVPIYEKADLRSRVIEHSPTGMTRLDTDYRIVGLDGNGIFFHISHLAKNSFILGFISADDVK